MPQRKALMLAVVIAAIASGGCGNKSYVRTSLGERHYVEPAVNRISEKRSNKERDGEASAQRDLAEMERYLSEGDFASVKQTANALLKRNPASIEAHTYLAVALDKSGDEPGAGQHYLRAAELAPTNGGMLGNYGIWLCEQGRVDDAMNWFDRALALPGFADSPVILANSGACADRVGQQQRAQRDLRRAIELDPQNPVALAALATREFKAGNAFEARAFSERRLAAAPADPKALLLASQIEQKLGDSSAAARYVSRLKTEFPDAPEARNSAKGDGGRQ
ncbi:tetratricopeptide repeat protein [Lysobacter tyrosinilyticus]